MSKKIKNILISQPKPSSEKSPYYDIAEKFGVSIHFRPFIKVERVSVKELRSQRINIAEVTAVIFTARTAIDNFFSLCEELRVTIPETMKYFCVSEAVALYLQKYIVYRKRKIFFSTTGKIDGLVASFTKHSKEKFILPVSDQHNDEVTRFLDSKKIDYTKSVMYRTVSNDFDNGEEFNYDMVVFFSPSGVVSMLKNFPDLKPGDLAMGCFGNTTAKALKDSGFTIDCEAPLPEYPSMTAALEAFLKSSKSKNGKL